MSTPPISSSPLPSPFLPQAAAAAAAPAASASTAAASGPTEAKSVGGQLVINGRTYNITVLNGPTSGYKVEDLANKVLAMLKNAQVLGNDFQGATIKKAGIDLVGKPPKDYSDSDAYKADYEELKQIIHGAQTTSSVALGRFPTPSSMALSMEPEIGVVPATPQRAPPPHRSLFAPRSRAPSDAAAVDDSLPLTSSQQRAGYPPQQSRKRALPSLEDFTFGPTAAAAAAAGRNAGATDDDAASLASLVRNSDSAELDLDDEEDEGFDVDVELAEADTEAKAKPVAADEDKPLVSTVAAAAPRRASLSTNTRSVTPLSPSSWTNSDAGGFGFYAH